MTIKYDVIIFDIDDTLCKNKNVKTDVFLKIYESIQKLKKIPRNNFVEICVESWGNYLGSLDGFNTYSRLGLWMNINEKFDLDLKIKDIKKIIDLYWKWSIDLTKPYPGLMKTLEFIKGKNLMLCALTSGDFYSKALKLIKLDIDSYFDYLFPTEIVQKDKSSGKLYEYVVKFLKVEPRKILMVGDKADQDIAPANKVGMTTVQTMMRKDQILHKKGINRPDFVINSLDEVINIINQKE